MSLGMIRGSGKFKLTASSGCLFLSLTQAVKGLERNLRYSFSRQLVMRKQEVQARRAI